MGKVTDRVDLECATRNRQFFEERGDARFGKIDTQFALKLLTAVARNDRFCEGAWAELFDAGDAQKLLHRIHANEAGPQPPAHR